MASVVQYGRRRGSSKRASSAEEVSSMIQPPDLRQVTVLSKAEWLRIQDSLNQVDKERQSLREATKQREALYSTSQEVVKQWSNTIAGQAQKQLEAKKIRDEIAEEKRKAVDKEEAEYQERNRKEAIEKAKTQLYYQTDRVKGFHRALLLTEVLKERDAQIELKQRIKDSRKDVDKDIHDMMKTKEDEALRQEQEKALQKKLERHAVAEDLKHRIKENLLVREQEAMENKKDGEEIQRLKEQYQWEQRMEEEKQARQKKDLMQAHLEQLTIRDLIRATDTQKQEAEEKKRKAFLTAKEKMIKLRKDREAELFREAQMRREKIKDKLTVAQQEKIDDEEQRIARAVAERDAKEAQKLWKEEEEKAAMLESIIAHRELLRQEKEQKDEMEKQNNRETLQAKKEADKTFSEKQKLKAQKNKEDGRKLQDFNAKQMAGKLAILQQLRRDDKDFEEKSAQLMAEEEKQFQQYSQQVISAAAEAQRNVFPLCKAAREGIGGAAGPVSIGVKPRYLVQDSTGVQMPNYVSGTTQNIKKLNEAVDIEEAKKRLGFSW
ncbi:Coiled-coil domain-containing protein 173 [Collichthys lucidus]|uniref:Coiled-coil domain-containing protein 173 n=1 Tax=Collichthys lucidus TaxID=240159 RepID=A0A4U5U319_COLLU|nr:Coiled-coil domain-containing protein 173 [Collichthys lucidus]